MFQEMFVYFFFFKFSLYFPRHMCLFTEFSGLFSQEERFRQDLAHSKFYQFGNRAEKNFHDCRKNKQYSLSPYQDMRREKEYSRVTIRKIFLIEFNLIFFISVGSFGRKSKLPFHSPYRLVNRRGALYHLTLPRVTYSVLKHQSPMCQYPTSSLIRNWW